MKRLSPLRFSSLGVLLLAPLLQGDIRITGVTAKDLGQGQVAITIEYDLAARSCTGRGTPAVSVSAEGDRAITVDGGKKCGRNTVTVTRRTREGATLSVGVFADGGADSWTGTVQFARDPANAALAFENDTARVYAVHTSIHGSRHQSASIAEWVLETLGTSTMTGFDPLTAAVSFVLGLIVSTLEEQRDPILVLPVTSGAVSQEPGRFRLTLRGASMFSAAVILDFIRVREHGGSTDVAQYASGLDLHLLRPGMRNRLVETRQLLSKEELRRLDPANAYVVIPKRPFDVRAFDGSVLTLSAGARYGPYGSPGTIHDHTIELRVDR